VPATSYILTALGAYLLGSIPFGYLAAKAKGIDIRNVGSGNIGATNALRVLGKPAGISVLLLDVLKGFAAVAWLTPVIYNAIEPHYFGLAPGFAAAAAAVQMKFKVLAGVGAVLGHNYTCWLKFKGGKGIATTAGVYLALAPEAVAVALVVFILAIMLTRFVSVGSIAAAIALPAAVWIMQPQNYFLGIVTTALGALAIYKHKSNLQRLMKGTENRFGKKKESQ
jgi:glycerol-3-phosphate acyltransferase PlsY